MVGRGQRAANASRLAPPGLPHRAEEFTPKMGVKLGNGLIHFCARKNKKYEKGDNLGEPITHRGTNGTFPAPDLLPHFFKKFAVSRYGSGGRRAG